MSQQGSRVGQRLGNYRLERLLGRGGFAEVYLGYHERLQRQAAIKVLYTHLSTQEEARFQHEAQVLARFDHPHIVRIYDFDVQQGVPFLAMDYLPNGTLRQRHGKGERVPVPTVVSYVKQVASALQYAHEQRVIHRDVKPENMLVGRHDEIVLSDFGIAALAHSTSSMSRQSSAGTVYYMAPEQLRLYARPASDQYALAIVAYEWLCGVRPFEGSYTEVLGKQLLQPPPPLRQYLPGLPPTIEQALLIALAKEPAARFESIQAFAEALTAASEFTQKLEDPSPKPHEITAIAPSSPVLPVHSAPAVSVPTPLATPWTHTPSFGSALSSAPPERKMSRRRVVVGLAALGVLTLSAGIAWVALHADSAQVSKPARTPDPTHTPNATQTPDPVSVPASVYTYRGHSAQVYAVTWSPDGTRIASGGGDNTVQVWKAADGSHVFTYRGHSSSVDALAWSPDSMRIASGNWDHTVQVWNAASGSRAFTYTGHDAEVYALAWSTQGTDIASAGVDHTVQVWSATDGSHVFTYQGHSDVVDTIGWSPDGTRLASGSWDHTVQVWKATDGSHVFTYQGHSDIVDAVTWSPDGTRIASGGHDQSVQVWNAGDGSHVFTYRGHLSDINAVAWSPDGARLASCGGNTVQVWNAADGSHVFTYKGHTSTVDALAWSPDGTRIASCGDDHTVQIWRPQEPG